VEEVRCYKHITYNMLQVPAHLSLFVYNEELFIIIGEFDDKP
jgi:hypothetical protein